MRAEDCSPELADTLYQEVHFTIDGDQFPEDAELPASLDVRYQEEHEARDVAAQLAEQFGQAVEVSVYGTWGHYGKEYVESFKVHPTLSRLLQNVNDDLAALGI